MHRERLVSGLAVAFGLMTAVFLGGAIVYSPALLILAVVFGVVTYILYEHATGQLMSRVYRGVERQAATDDRGGFGAGPREEWAPPRDDQRRRARARENARRARANGRRQRAQTGQVHREGPTPREAYEVLGVDPGSDEQTVRRAYRDRIKEVHPDTDGGDEEEFKRVQAAYEVLTG